MKLYLICKYTLLALAALLGVAILAATIVSAIKESAAVLLVGLPFLAGWSYLTYLIAVDKF